MNRGVCVLKDIWIGMDIRLILRRTILRRMVVRMMAGRCLVDVYVPYIRFTVYILINTIEKMFHVKHFT